MATDASELKQLEQHPAVNSVQLDPAPSLASRAINAATGDQSDLAAAIEFSTFRAWDGNGRRQINWSRPAVYTFLEDVAQTNAYIVRKIKRETVYLEAK